MMMIFLKIHKIEKLRAKKSKNSNNNLFDYGALMQNHITNSLKMEMVEISLFLLFLMKFYFPSKIMIVKCFDNQFKNFL